MDIVIEIVGELIFELLFDGAVEASKNQKLPVILRIVFMVLVILISVAIIGLVFYSGLMLLKKYLIAGILIISIGILLLISAFKKFRQIYLTKSQGRKDDVK